MISKPNKSEGKYTLRGRVSIVVARRPKERSKNFIGIDFGYSFAEKEIVKIVIDKNVIFELDTFHQTAWTNPAEKSQQDDAIINEMIKGSKLEAFGKSSRGTVTTDYYSLKGFSIIKTNLPSRGEVRILSRIFCNSSLNGPRRLSRYSFAKSIRVPSIL